MSALRIEFGTRPRTSAPTVRLLRDNGVEVARAEVDPLGATHYFWASAQFADADAFDAFVAGMAALRDAAARLPAQA
jgi:hypothetical protein